MSLDVLGHRLSIHGFLIAVFAFPVALQPRFPHPPGMINHDRLFKELLTEFFAAFIDLFDMTR